MKYDAALRLNAGLVEKYALTADYSLNLSGLVNPMPLPDVAPPGNGPSQGTEDVPLGIGVLTSASEHSLLDGDDGWVWAGGWGNPLRGGLNVVLTTPMGGTHTTTVTPDSNGKWTVLFGGVLDVTHFGLDYKLGVSYANDATEVEETITLPKLQLQLKF